MFLRPSRIFQNGGTLFFQCGTEAQTMTLVYSWISLL